MSNVINSEFAAHQQAKRLFDRTTDKYSRRSRGSVSNFTSLIFRRRIGIVASSIQRAATAGGEALDYGMGPAVFAESCTAAGMHYLGIDVSPKMVERSKEMGLSNSEFIVGDLETLSRYRNQKDLVLAIGLIDYLEDVPAGISQLAACVRPGGNLILSFRNRYSLPRLLRDGSKKMARRLLNGSSRFNDKAFFAQVHEKSFDLNRHLVPQLASLGFSGFEAHYFNCSPFFFNFPMPKLLWRVWYAIDQTLARSSTRFLCSGGVVVGTKSLS